MELFKSRILQEHYRNPRNAGCMEDPDGRGRASNPLSGEVIEIYLKIESDRILEARFKSFGSPAAIAVSSLLTETVKGKKTEDAISASSEVLDEIAGGLSQGDLHSLELARSAFLSAIDDYRSRSADWLKAATG